MKMKNPCIDCLIEPLCTEMCERVKPYFYSQVKVGKRTVTINTKNTLYGGASDDIRDITFDVGGEEKMVLELKEKYCGPIKKKTKKKKVTKRRSTLWQKLKSLNMLKD